LSRVAHQRLEHGELAGGQRQFFADLAQGAGAQVEVNGPNCTTSRSRRRVHPGFLAGAAAQHGMHAGQQFARVEGLAQVIVSADLQAHDAVHVLDPWR
jgi:hypothetical protein